MGRKPILASQRSIPVSFSVKPALYDRIENMAYDQRFTRSKFLAEAVTRYMLFIEMNDTEHNLNTMTDQQRVVIGINALQEMNRFDEELSPAVYQQLKKQLEIYELKMVVRDVNTKESTTQEKRATETLDSDINFEKVKNRREYRIFNNGSQIGLIEYDDDFKSWITSIGNDRDSHRTLKHAKLTVVEAFE